MTMTNKKPGEPTVAAKLESWLSTFKVGKHFTIHEAMAALSLEPLQHTAVMNRIEILLSKKMVDTNNAPLTGNSVFRVKKKIHVWTAPKAKAKHKLASNVVQLRAAPEPLLTPQPEVTVKDAAPVAAAKPVAPTKGIGTGRASNRITASSLIHDWLHDRGINPVGTVVNTGVIYAALKHHKEVTPSSISAYMFQHGGTSLQRISKLGKAFQYRITDMLYDGAAVRLTGDFAGSVEGRPTTHTGPQPFDGTVNPDPIIATQPETTMPVETPVAAPDYTVLVGQQVGNLLGGLFDLTKGNPDAKQAIDALALLFKGSMDKPVAESTVTATPEPEWLPSVERTVQTIMDEMMALMLEMAAMANAKPDLEAILAVTPSAKMIALLHERNDVA